MAILMCLQGRCTACRCAPIFPVTKFSISRQRMKTKEDARHLDNPRQRLWICRSHRALPHRSDHYVWGKVGPFRPDGKDSVRCIFEMLDRVTTRRQEST